MLSLSRTLNGSSTITVRNARRCSTQSTTRALDTCMYLRSIGAKRNYLCDAANAEVIVQFDDDDFYAPHYVESMLSLMRDQNADIVKLFGFFLYQPKHKVFAYWDLERDFPLHFRLSPAGRPAFGDVEQRSNAWQMGLRLLLCILS